jgi:ketosteroid isomerase-like protein
MSQENVEIVRATFEALNAGDMGAIRERLDPDAMIVTALEDWPEPVPIVGREAVMRQFEQLRETFDVASVETISDYIDSGDRVVVRTAYHGEGHGPALNMEMTVVYTVRKGKIFLYEYFWDHAEALEAVGLSEQDVHADS